MRKLICMNGVRFYADEIGRYENNDHGDLVIWWKGSPSMGRRFPDFTAEQLDDILVEKFEAVRDEATPKELTPVVVCSKHIMEDVEGFGYSFCRMCGYGSEPNILK